MTTETEAKTETVSQAEFDKAFQELMGLPAEIAALRRRLKALEDRQHRAKQIVNQARGK